MSDALYERYKEALRRGHVAAQRSRLDEALDAYGEAARIAPDRASPLVGIGQVLNRLDKGVEALSAFDMALDRSPADEIALRGRIELLARAGDRVGAAATLDRLVAVLDAARRLPEALDAAGRALDLAESRARRAALRAMVERIEADPDTASMARPALGRATTLLAGPIGPEPEPTPPPEPAFDAAAAMAAVEAALATGDPRTTREAALSAARGHRAAGHIHAAIDACYQAIATNPASADLHLTLAELYLDRGWKTIAADKLVLIARLVDLETDVTTRDRLCEVAARVPEDTRLEAICN